MSASVSVDFPAPGAPVMPTVYARPVCGKSDATAAMPVGPALFDERDQPRDRAAIVVERALDERGRIAGGTGAQRATDCSEGRGRGGCGDVSRRRLR